jgi:hypothetical protein
MHAGIANGACPNKEGNNIPFGIGQTKREGAKKESMAREEKILLKMKLDQYLEFQTVDPVLLLLMLK